MVSKEKQCEINRVSQAILRFLNDIQSLHNLFKESPLNTYNQFMEGAESARSVEHCREFLHQAKKLSMGILQGSDTTLVYVKDDNSEASRMVVSGWLAKLHRIIIDALSDGILIRGCLTRGLGWEIRENCLFGPVIQQADYIEKHLANYPRIVVAGSFYSLCVHADKRLQTAVPKPNNEINSFRMLCVDDDGMVFYDYLGKVALTIMEQMYLAEGKDVSLLRSRLNLVQELVCGRLEEHKSNPRVSEIYQKLLGYINGRTNLYLNGAAT